MFYFMVFYLSIVVFQKKRIKWNLFLHNFTIWINWIGCDCCEFSIYFVFCNFLHFVQSCIIISHISITKCVIFNFFRIKNCMNCDGCLSETCSNSCWLWPFYTCFPFFKFAMFSTGFFAPIVKVRTNLLLFCTTILIKLRSKSTSSNGFTRNYTLSWDKTFEMWLIANAFISTFVLELLNTARFWILSS